MTQSSKAYAHPAELGAVPVAVGAVEPRYVAPIQIVHAAEQAPGDMLWAMRNGTTKRMNLRRLRGVFGYVGTPVPDTLRYGIYRFAGAAPTGGVSIVPLRFDTADPLSTAADCRSVATGLSVAGVIFSSVPLAILSLPLFVTLALPVNGVAPAARTDFALDLSGYVLHAGEGVTVRVEGAAGDSTLIGQSLIGELEWTEGAL